MPSPSHSVWARLHSVWARLHPQASVDGHLGFIPDFINPDDPRPLKEQLNDAYAHGGGWRPFKGFKLDQDTLVLQYPGEPPTLPLFMTVFRGDTVVVYQYAWVAIIQKDGSFEVSRMD